MNSLIDLKMINSPETQKAPARNTMHLLTRILFDPFPPVPLLTLGLPKLNIKTSSAVPLRFLFKYAHLTSPCIHPSALFHTHKVHHTLSQTKI